MNTKSMIALLLSTLLAPAQGSGCIDKATYYSIDEAVETIASGIADQDERVHFFGGIVRLAAHDFMDYDRHDGDDPQGSNGCIDWDHRDNKGLWGTIWCDECELTKVYEDKYSHVSKADFWIAAANAVIRQLSVDRSLDLIDTFLWGREDAEDCEGQGDRMPTGTGCREIEDTLLDAMGLEWRDAVALLGAHTIGKGHADFSGHDGYWMPTTADAFVFDKQYYEELVRRPWRARNLGTKDEDFTASTEESHEEPQFMLKTDVCLWFDTDNFYPCCSRIARYDDNGNNWCDFEQVLSNKECTRYESDTSRMEAVETVVEFLGGPPTNQNNDPFYKAFAVAWFKATTNGHDSLKAVRSECRKGDW